MMRLSLPQSLVIISFLCLLACNKRNNYIDSNIAATIELSGTNKQQLLQALEYAENTSDEKSKAMRYIIANMAYHNGYTFDESEGYRSITDSIDHYMYALFHKNEDTDIPLVEPYKNFRKQLTLSFNRELFLGFPDGPIDDARIISSGYLIDNLEHSFNSWQNSSYAKSLRFEDFCEMLLPYRAYVETFPMGKKDLQSEFKNILKPSGGEDIRQVINRFMLYVKRCRWLLKYADINTHSNHLDILIPKFVGECQNVAAWTCDIFRSCGVPCVIEYTPQWQDRPRAHFWCCVIDNDGILKPFTSPDNNLLEDWESNLQYAGKVYRINYGANPASPHFLTSKKEIIPDNLVSPLITDETHRYHSTITIEYSSDQPIDNNLAYLCFFDRNKPTQLNAVAWGVTNHANRTIKFEKVPLNMIFFPAVSDSIGILRPIGDPFMIKDEGSIKYRRKPNSLKLNETYNELFFRVENNRLLDSNCNEVADLVYTTFKPSDTLTSIKVLRKNPLKRTLLKSHAKLKGSIWLGGNNIEGKFDTICTLDFIPKPYLQEIALSKTGKYRFIKFMTADEGPVNIAHMEFLSDNYSKGTVIPTKLPIFDKDDTYIENSYRLIGNPMKFGSSPKTAFDGNMDTYSGSKVIGYDFGYPKEFSRIRFAPRNANNGVVPDDEYELYVFNKGWKKIKQIKATSEHIIFDSVPENSIYWLKNITSGNEEHPFLYSCDKGQIFINKTE